MIFEFPLLKFIVFAGNIYLLKSIGSSGEIHLMSYRVGNKSATGRV